jgi:two-component system nitrogen regulation response regulator GlnG
MMIKISGKSWPIWSKRKDLPPLLAPDAISALELLRRQGAEMMLVDVRLPDRDGLEVLKEATELDPDLPVVMITAYAGVNQAVEAMRAGAHDYLSKPFRHHQVIRLIHRALTERGLSTALHNFANVFFVTLSRRRRVSALTFRFLAAAGGSK